VRTPLAAFFNRPEMEKGVGHVMGMVAQRPAVCDWRCCRLVVKRVVWRRILDSLLLAGFEKAEKEFDFSSTGRGQGIFPVSGGGN
jgi:hypothetical protein